MITGYIAGTWDLLHEGHIKILEKAAENCDRLWVGVCTDEYCNSYGKKPVMNVNERKLIIKNLKMVDQVFFHNDETINKIYPMINKLFVGEDYPNTKSHAKGLEIAKNNNVEIIVFSRTPNISSTIIKERIKKC
jgi:cytidyltransferase-like protein